LVAIGNFDGVHAGHRAVLSAASADAKAQSLSLLVLTFHPHPAEVLGRGAQAVLTPLERKVELLCRLDPKLCVVVEPFTTDLAAMAPEDFVEKLLLSSLGAKVVVVGQNFRFGHGRAGDLKLLERLGAQHGFEACAEMLAGDDGGPFSSSRVRASIQKGDLAEAERLLGRPHALSGTVVRGDGRGKQLGIPTANITGVLEALPPNGVYATLVDRIQPDGTPKVLAAGVTNIGTRPTVGAGFSVETYVFDFDGDLYGERLRVHLVERVRDERRFASLDALVAQIHSDIDTARRFTSVREPDPAAGGAWY
jgi:riboflavin kinase/FMN adenylyltransferase